MANHDGEGSGNKWIYFLGATIILLWLYGQLYLGAGLTDKTPEEILSEAPQGTLDNDAVRVRELSGSGVTSGTETHINELTADIARLEQEIAQLREQNASARRVVDTTSTSPNVDVVLKEGEHGTVRFVNESGQVIEIYRY